MTGLLASVPGPYIEYFDAASAASGALVGLLFVAVTLRPDTVFGESAPPEGRALAGSAFTSLVNAFFLSLVALAPDINFGVGVAVLAVLALASTIRLHRRLRAGERHRVLLALSVAVFVLQGGEGIALALHANDRGFLAGVVYATLSSLGVSLARAWQLMEGKHLAHTKDPGPTSS